MELNNRKPKRSLVSQIKDIFKKKHNNNKTENRKNHNEIIIGRGKHKYYPLLFIGKRKRYNYRHRIIK